MATELIAVYVALGALVGFLARLLGIGGGMTIVPLLVALFTLQGFALEHVLPLAIGTAAATIVFTSLSSARAHHAHGAVDWSIVRAMAPGLVIGSLVGPQIATALPARTMAAVFAVFMGFTAWRMVRNPQPKPSRSLPAAPQQQAAVEHARQEGAAQAQAAAPSANVTAELQKLAELHKSGVLSDAEFAAAKAKLLG